MDNNKNSKMWFILNLVLAVLIVLVLAGLLLVLLWPSGGKVVFSRDNNPAQIQAAVPSADERQTQTEIVIQATSADDEKDDKDTKSDDKDTKSDDYILPESSSRVLTTADVEGLSPKELNYARNEIYARHGRMFDSPELQKYFNSKSWYKGQYSPDDFDSNIASSVLSSIEKKNVEFLQNEEEKEGGYQLDQ